MYRKIKGILFLLIVLPAACMPEHGVPDRPSADTENPPNGATPTEVPTTQKCRTNRTTEEKNICQEHGGGSSCSEQCWTSEMEETVTKAISATSCPFDKTKENLCPSDPEQRCLDGQPSACLLAADNAALTNHADLEEKYLKRGCYVVNDPPAESASQVQKACSKLGDFYENREKWAEAGVSSIRACELTFSKKLHLSGPDSGCTKAASLADQAGQMQRPYLFMACALQDSDSCVKSCAGEESVQASMTFPPSWWNEKPNGVAPFKDLPTTKSECVEPTVAHPWVPTDLAGISFSKAANSCMDESKTTGHSESCFTAANIIAGWINSGTPEDQRIAAEKCASALYERSCTTATYTGSPLQACASSAKYYALLADDLAKKGDMAGAANFGKRGTDFSCRLTLVPTDPVLASGKSSWVWPRCAALVRQGDAVVTKACRAIANYPKPPE